MAIADEDVARVRAATDIVALISEHAGLKRQGTRWVGLCPFHQEKSPSFSVNAEIGVYYCFGCQRSGDAITFVRDVEHLDFVEAVRRLADRAGIIITEDEAVSAERQRRAPLFDAMEKAVVFYHERLVSAADAGPARDYLRSRGYDGDVVRQFRLGWAPDEWDSLARHLGVGEKVLVDSGLGFVNRRGRKQDSFRARLMFPIFDPSGKAVALGGRILPPPLGASASSDGPVGPKYKNSAEGPIYSKRRTLYGLNWAKQDVVASTEVIVCEGYTDVIAFFEAGLPRAVATCGTALGEEHFRVLGNFARRLVLAYDADTAGQAGAGRVYEWERHHEVDVAVATLPPGTDPADLVRQDPDALRRAVADAKPFLLFRLERVLEAADLRTLEGRAKAAEAATAVVAEHPNDLVRDQYLMVVADRCRLDAATLRPLLEGAALRVAAPSGNGQSRVNGARGGPHRGEAALRPGLEALRLTVHHPELVGDRLEPVLFSDPLQRAAFEALMTADSLHEAIEEAEGSASEAGAVAVVASSSTGDEEPAAVDDDPPVARLLRRLAVEEPVADADGVVVQLVRIATRRALAEVEAQARLSPQSYAEVASVTAKVRRDLDDLDMPGRGAQAATRLLAWLVERGEESA